MMSGSSGSGLCPWSCSGEIGAMQYYVKALHELIVHSSLFTPCNSVGKI